MTKTFSTSSGADPDMGSKLPSHSARQPDSRRDLHSSDPYVVLGVHRNASPREIKRVYFDLVREYPPEEQPDTFKLVRAAYEKLRNADVKAETDLFLFQPPYAWEPRKRRKSLDLDVHPEDLIFLLQRFGDLGRTNFTEDYELVRL